MALAILQFEDADERAVRFRADLGKNRFYQYTVGGSETVRTNGLKRIADPRFTSPLLGPLPERAVGRTRIDAPRDLFSGDVRFVQLLSFRNRQQHGPAVSEIVEVPRSAPGRASPEEREAEDLPSISFARGRRDVVAQEVEMTTASHIVETVPNRIRESRSRYSESLFLQAIVGALPSLLPSLAPAIGGLLGGLFGGGSGGAKTSEKITTSLKDPETIKAITQLLTQLQGTKTPAAQPTGDQTAGTAQSLTAHRGAVSRAARSRRGARGRSAALAARGSPLTRYSEAQAAPALLAALPALAPLLQQVLNPQTIQAILKAPTAHVGTLISGFKDLAKIGIESHEQDLRHIRAMVPEVDDPGLEQLLAGLSQGLSQASRDVDYTRVSSVRLNFEEVQSETLYGRSRIAYQWGVPLRFPMSVETPQPIRQGVLHLAVKDSRTLEVLHETKYRVEQVQTGPLLTVPTLDEARVRTLQPSRDYLVCVTLVWKNSKGRQRGTSMQQSITLVSEYTFDRVEESGDLIPLEDVDRFRAFWHKVWQGSFTDEMKRYEFDCKYYYVLNPDRDSNARIETKTRLREDDGRREGKLKSGMELSPAALNRLLAMIAPELQPLTEQELLPLRSGDFADRFNQAARYRAELRGRAGDSAALWVYPVFKLQSVILQRIGETNDNGNVLGFVEHAVRFPMPSQVHFIGVRTQ